MFKSLVLVLHSFPSPKIRALLVAVAVTASCSVVIIAGPTSNSVIVFVFVVCSLAASTSTFFLRAPFVVALLLSLASSLRVLEREAKLVGQLVPEQLAHRQRRRVPAHPVPAPLALARVPLVLLLLREIELQPLPFPPLIAGQLLLLALLVLGDGVAVLVELGLLLVLIVLLFFAAGGGGGARPVVIRLGVARGPAPRPVLDMMRFMTGVSSWNAIENERD